MDLPDCLDQETWADYKKYRLTECKRKAFGPVAQKRALKKIERLHNDGFDIIECIDYAVNNGWIGIFGKDDFRRQKRPLSHSTAKVIELPTSDKKTAERGLAAMREAL